MERFVGKIAVVTGSSKGIGQEISKELLKRGVTVIGLSRNIRKLQELFEEFLRNPNTYSGKFHPLQCDVSKEKEIQNTFANIKKNIGPITILVNNAGVCVTNDNDLQKINGECIDTIFDTNTKGLLLCAKEAMNSMTEHNIAGHIININSVLGLPEYHMELFNVYAASKHAARILSDALRREVTRKKLKIKISNVSPGIVDTDMPRGVGFAFKNDKETLLSPQDIVNACITILDTPPNVLISELTVMGIHAS